jgi:hypothetical protein
MSKKLRKMLGDKDAPRTKSLLQLIESQSKATVCKWCMDYAEAQFLPIFERRCPSDSRPRHALDAARDYLNSKLTFSEAKGHIWYYADGETDGDPIIQAAENAIGQAASVVRYPSKWHALAVYFYGAAAVAYDRVGLNESAEVYDAIAAEECTKMEAALRAVAME